MAVMGTCAAAAMMTSVVDSGDGTDAFAAMIAFFLDSENGDEGLFFLQAQDAGGELLIIVSGKVQVCPWDNLKEDLLTPKDRSLCSTVEAGQTLGETSLFQVCASSESNSLLVLIPLFFHETSGPARFLTRDNTFLGIPHT